MISRWTRRWATTLAVTASLAVAGTAMAQVQVPAPGTSPRIDAIKKAGALRVGVLANAPWLVENTTGSGEAWSGAAWTLAKEYARLLNVKLEPNRAEQRAAWSLYVEISTLIASQPFNSDTGKMRAVLSSLYTLF